MSEGTRVCARARGCFSFFFVSRLQGTAVEQNVAGLDQNQISKSSCTPKSQPGNSVVGDQLGGGLSVAQVVRDADNVTLAPVTMRIARDWISNVPVCSDDARAHSVSHHVHSEKDRKERVRKRVGEGEGKVKVQE